MSVSDHCTSHCCWAPALPLPEIWVMLVWSWYLISIAWMLPLLNCFSSSAGLLNVVSGMRVRLELCLWAGFCLFVTGGSGVSVVVLIVVGGPCCCGCAACFCQMAVSSLSLCVRLVVGLLSAGSSLRLGGRSLTDVYRSGSSWDGSWFVMSRVIWLRARFSVAWVAGYLVLSSVVVMNLLRSWVRRSSSVVMPMVCRGSRIPLWRGYWWSGLLAWVFLA